MHDHSLIDSREIQEACKSMYQYIGKVGESIANRFPEIYFIINNTMFLDPRMRHMQQPDFSSLVQRFNHGEGPIVFSVDTLKMQYNVFKKDSTVDVQFTLHEEDRSNSGVCFMNGRNIGSLHPLDYFCYLSLLPRSSAKEGFQ